MAAGTRHFHHDLDGVVNNQARDHGIRENREHLRPRQWHESRKTCTRQDGACERGRHEGPAGHRRPECAALARRHHRKHGKVEQHQEGEGAEGIVVGGRQQHRKGGETNLAVTTYVMAAKAAFKMVRLSLLIIHVRMR
jgi:hypothetical protein